MMYDSSDASSNGNPGRFARGNYESRSSLCSSASGGGAPDDAETLAARYSITVVELKKMYKIWPLIKGLAEWRRDDPASTPTDLSDLISTLTKYHPHLGLATDTDGYLATFVEAKNQDITLEKLLATKHTWDPLVAHLTIRRTRPRESAITRGVLPKSSTNLILEDFGISEFMKKLVMSANSIESAVRHQHVEKLHLESEKLSVLADNFVLQLEDASRFILEAKSTRNDASRELSEKLKEEASRHADRVQMMENMMKDSEETVAALTEDLNEAQQRIHELTEEVESKTEAMEEAKAEQQRLLLALATSDKESLEHYVQLAESEKKKRAALLITYRLQKYAMKKNFEASSEEIDRLEKRLFEMKVSIDETSAYNAALTEDNERLRDEADKLNEKVDGLLSYVNELQTNARHSSVKCDDMSPADSPKPGAGAALIDELGGEFLNDRAVAYAQATEQAKDISLRMLVTASMNAAVARDRENIANAIRNKGDAETRSWLVPRLLAAGWASEDVAELIKWRLGITYRCVRQSRRRTVSIDDCSTDVGSDDLGSQRGSGAEHGRDYRGSGAERGGDDTGSRRGSDANRSSRFESKDESVRRSQIADLRRAVERTRGHAEWVKSSRNSGLGLGSRHDNTEWVSDDSFRGYGSERTDRVFAR